MSDEAKATETKETKKADSKAVKMVKVRALRVVTIPGKFQEDGKTPATLGEGQEAEVTEAQAKQMCVSYDGPLSADTVNGKYHPQKIVMAEIVK